VENYITKIGGKGEKKNRNVKIVEV